MSLRSNKHMSKEWFVVLARSKIVFYCFFLQNYEMVYEDSVTAATTGVNYYLSTDAFSVNQGDIIGVIQLTGTLFHEATAGAPCYELQLSTGYTGGGTFSVTSGMTCFAGQHQFLAHMIKV